METKTEGALRDIETARSNAVDEIDNRISLDAQMNSDTGKIAKEALETALATEKAVVEFISNQGNLKDRVDALEEARQ